jgi:ABC-2 type transport system permease protein
MSVAPRFSLHRLRAIARKEIIQLRRDPRSLAMAFLMPAALILLFGFAITFDVRDIRLGVLDRDRTQASRDLVQAFTSSGYFVRATDPRDDREATELLQHGRVRLVLVIPPGFARALAGGGSAEVQAAVDGGDANTAAIALNYAGAIVGAWSADATLHGRVVTPALAVESRVWYNEELKSSNMIVPGLVAVVMMVVAAMLTSLTIAREWERGTMEQLAATPVHRVEVIIGKLLPYLLIGFVDVLVAIALGVGVFATPFRGNPVWLLGTTFFFLLGSLGLGIFISAAVKSQVLATQTAMIATYLPSLLLSGLMFDIASMPLALRVVSHLVPARYFITVTRGVFLKGVGPDVLWPQGLGMILFAAIGLGLAVRAFRKETG